MPNPLIAAIGGAVGSTAGSVAGALGSQSAAKSAMRAQERQQQELINLQKQQLGMPTAEFPLGTPVGLAWYTRGFEPTEFGYARNLYDALKRSPAEVAASYEGVKNTLAPAQSIIGNALGGAGTRARLDWLVPVEQAREEAAKVAGGAIEQALRGARQATQSNYSAQGYGGAGTTLGRRLAELQYGAATEQAKALADAILQNRLAEAAAREAGYQEQLGMAQNAAQLAQALASIERLPATAAGQEMAALWSIPSAVSATNKQFAGPSPINYGQFVEGLAQSPWGAAFGSIGGGLSGIAGILQQQQNMSMMQAENQAMRNMYRDLFNQYRNFGG